MITIKKPIITEKSLKAYKDDNKVTFEVTLGANKLEAARALEKVYGVSVEDIKVVNRLGKSRLNPRTGKTLVRKKPDQKIMVFKLKKGNKISLFEK